MNPKEATWKIDNELTQVWYLGSDDRVAEAHLDVVKSEKIIQQCVDDAIALVDARWKERLDAQFAETVKQRQEVERLEHTCEKLAKWGHQEEEEATRLRTLFDLAEPLVKIQDLTDELKATNMVYDITVAQVEKQAAEVERLRELIWKAYSHPTTAQAILHSEAMDSIRIALHKSLAEPIEPQAEKPVEAPLDMFENDLRRCAGLASLHADEIAMEGIATDCPRVAVDDVLAILKDCGIADQSIIVSRIKAERRWEMSKKETKQTVGGKDCSDCRAAAGNIKLPPFVGGFIPSDGIKLTDEQRKNLPLSDRDKAFLQLVGQAMQAYPAGCYSDWFRNADGIMRAFDRRKENRDDKG